MSPRDQELFTYVAADRLVALGYERGRDGPPPTRTELLRHRVVNGTGRTVNFVKHRLITERGHELRYVVQRRRTNAVRSFAASGWRRAGGGHETIPHPTSGGGIVIDLRDHLVRADVEHRAAPDPPQPNT